MEGFQVHVDSVGHSTSVFLGLQLHMHGEGLGKELHHTLASSKNSGPKIIHPPINNKKFAAPGVSVKVTLSQGEALWFDPAVGTLLELDTTVVWGSSPEVDWRKIIADLPRERNAFDQNNFAQNRFTLAQPLTQNTYFGQFSQDFIFDVTRLLIEF
eukprot:742061-Amphidinium_carterae.1